jgi:hypothetical protein
MTKLLERAVAQLRELPEETQDLAAEALFIVIDHVNDDERYRMCVIWAKAATDSGAIRPPILIEVGHPL